MRSDKAKQDKLMEDATVHKNKAFMRQVELGRITFDHLGKTMEVRSLKSDKLPPEFKNLMNHYYEQPPAEHIPQKLNIKKKKKDNDDTKDEAKG